MESACRTNEPSWPAPAAAPGDPAGPLRSAQAMARASTVPTATPAPEPAPVPNPDASAPPHPGTDQPSSDPRKASASRSAFHTALTALLHPLCAPPCSSAAAPAGAVPPLPASPGPFPFPAHRDKDSTGSTAAEPPPQRGRLDRPPLSRRPWPAPTPRPPSPPPSSSRLAPSAGRAPGVSLSSSSDDANRSSRLVGVVPAQDPSTPPTTVAGLVSSPIPDARCQSQLVSTAASAGRVARAGSSVRGPGARVALLGADSGEVSRRSRDCGTRPESSSSPCAGVPSSVDAGPAVSALRAAPWPRVGFGITLWQTGCQTRTRTAELGQPVDRRRDSSRICTREGHVVLSFPSAHLCRRTSAWSSSKTAPSTPRGFRASHSSAAAASPKARQRRSTEASRVSAARCSGSHPAGLCVATYSSTSARAYANDDVRRLATHRVRALGQLHGRPTHRRAHLLRQTRVSVKSAQHQSRLGLQHANRPPARPLQKGHGVQESPRRVEGLDQAAGRGCVQARARNILELTKDLCERWKPPRSAKRIAAAPWRQSHAAGDGLDPKSPSERMAAPSNFPRTRHRSASSSRSEM